MIINEKVDTYRELIGTISERQNVELVLGNKILASSPTYFEDTDKMIIKKNILGKDIAEYYDRARTGRVGMYEDVTEFLERMDNTMEKDEDGHVLQKYYKLGIQAIDDEFFNGKGVFSNAFIAIGADSGVGKTTLALNIISSFARQGVKSQFFSFEMGDVQFFNEISPEAKNKLRSIVKTEYAENLTLDFHSRDIEDLANSIQTRYRDGVKAFVIDSYLSIYAGHDEFRKMKEVVDMLATLKKELGILIILIGQISKSDSFNEIYDFHGGNILKYESDVAIFIKLLEGEEDTTKRLMHCEKNRIFEENAKKGIITEYNRDTHKIEKLCNVKDYARDKDGKELRKFNFKK